MKTPNLDHEIERLNLLERTNDLSEYGKELITEYKAIKKALSLHNVSQQRELLIAFDNMREFDIKHDDIEESVNYFLKNKESYLL
tara:strand:+ start:244 stop:498 length:255 start_codon:yes stop_codon:yes gene_type:complete